MLASNSTKGTKIVYSSGGHDETLDDIVLQIWNDGAEGIIYSESDLKDFRRRLKKALVGGKRHNG